MLSNSNLEGVSFNSLAPMAKQISSPSAAVERRSFFAALVAAGSSCIAALLGIPLVRAALFPLRGLGSQTQWSDLGPQENFAALKEPATQLLNIQRQDGWQLITAQQIVYVVAAPGGAPRVLSSTCPHLGCTVQWRGEKDEFICPCHGGTYAPDGSRVSGPPARGMDELPTRIQDGRLYVQYQNFRQLLATKEVVD